MIVNNHFAFKQKIDPSLNKAMNLASNLLNLSSGDIEELMSYSEGDVSEISDIHRVCIHYCISLQLVIIIDYKFIDILLLLIYK